MLWRKSGVGDQAAGRGVGWMCTGGRERQTGSQERKGGHCAPGRGGKKKARGRAMGKGRGEEKGAGHGRGALHRRLAHWQAASTRGLAHRLDGTQAGPHLCCLEALPHIQVGGWLVNHVHVGCGRKARGEHDESSRKAGGEHEESGRRAGTASRSPHEARGASSATQHAGRTGHPSQAEGEAGCCGPGTALGACCGAGCGSRGGALSPSCAATTAIANRCSSPPDKFSTLRSST